MKRWTAFLFVAALTSLTGCVDGVLRSERVLGSVEISHEAITATEGEVVPLTVRVLDQNGRPFDRFPAWVKLDWESSDEGLVSTLTGQVLAREPGQAMVTVSVADRSATARVRVNPERITVRIDGINLSQSVQRPDGSIPMVSGRDGYLRIFVTADQANFFEAGLRVRLYNGATLRQSWSLSAPLESIPVALTEGVLTSTWNLAIPGDLIRPGLGVLVDVDPDGRLPTTAQSQLLFPANGQPVRPAVHELPTLHLHLVPITDAHGSTGNVSLSNRAQYLDPLVRMFPVDGLEVTVRSSPFVSIYPAEFLDDWLGILYQMAALRAAEGSEAYYYGVVQRARGNINGIGFLGHPAAVGFDALPEASFTLAHELGHNFDQLHTPCGNPASIDPDYPHAGGLIGVYGMNVTAQELVSPTVSDIMGYCQPRWVSDYIYERILDFRQNREAANTGPAPAQPSLLVWGRITAQGLQLEPAFEVHAPVRLPSGGGPFMIEGRSASGGTVFSYPFTPLTVPHATPDEGFFVFVLPLDAAGAAGLRSLHLRGGGRQTSRVARPTGDVIARAASPATPDFRLERRAGRAVLNWQADVHPMVMVRDPQSGQVLAFARDGAVDLPGVDRELELVFSDGVRSTRVRSRPR